LAASSAKPIKMLVYFVWPILMPRTKLPTLRWTGNRESYGDRDSSVKRPSHWLSRKQCRSGHRMTWRIQDARNRDTILLPLPSFKRDTHLTLFANCCIDWSRYLETKTWIV
jgi:hypothetical protein